MYKNWQKMMGTNYWKWIIQVNVVAGKLKTVGGGKRTTVNAPRGPKREKTGGVGVTLCAVSNGRMIRNNTVPISETDPF